VTLREAKPLLLGALLVAVLVATAVPAPFTVDDNHYLVAALAARQGRLTVASTAGMPPSRELLFFDPAGFTRDVRRTPVVPTAPPLYGFLALPWIVFGWRGLVALEALAFVATAFLVARLARRVGATPGASAMAVATFLLGSFGLEYAQGLWPHCLATALVTAAVLRVVEALEEPEPEGRAARRLAAAGLFAGLATGVRYQDAVVLACLGVGVLRWSRPLGRRLRAACAFGAAAAGPLIACSLLNHARLGSWNPISKGPGYLRLAEGTPALHPLLDVLRTAWFLVVDYTTRPPLLSPRHTYVRVDEATGVHLIGEATKKALLQSAPWALLALLALAAAWWPRRRAGGGSLAGRRLPGLVVGGVVAAFALAGSRRTDGLCFNQRYLLEVMPLLAVAAAISLGEVAARRRALQLGAIGGAAAAVLLVSLPAGTARWWGLSRVPLALAVALGLAAVVHGLRPPRNGSPAASRPASALLAGLFGAALGWALLVHLGEDLRASRELRAINAERAGLLRRHLPARAALVGYWGASDAAGPLLFDHDLLVIDPSRDGGATLPAMVAAARRTGRPLYALSAVPPQVRAVLLATSSARFVDDERALMRLDALPAAAP
jgi:hypothetical protein